MKSCVILFAQAVVNRGKCNSVDAVLDDYDSATDSFYYYRTDYELYKEIIKLLENNNEASHSD